jgi:hypothetical protein
LAALDLARERLTSSRLSGNPLESAQSVVGCLCAVQAQDYPGAKWAIAQRAEGVTDAGIDQLFHDGVIVRTHVLRPTWHIVLPADIRWLLQLTAPRVKAASAYYERALGLESGLFARSNRGIGEALAGGLALTRAEIGDALGRRGIDVDNQRLGHLLMRAELDGIVCSGGLRGRNHTYALLDERVPSAASLEGDAALAELATRYFTSHGPAQVADFAWWSGLTIRQARSAVQLATPALDSAALDGRTYFYTELSSRARRRRPLAQLVPNYDEYLVGYADRRAHVAPDVFPAPPTSMDLLANSVVVDGQVVGGWRRTAARGEVVVTTTLRMALSSAQRAGLERACERYGRFLGRPVALVTS